MRFVASITVFDSILYHLVHSIKYIYRRIPCHDGPCEVYVMNHSTVENRILDLHVDRKSFEKLGEVIYYICLRNFFFVNNNLSLTVYY